MNNLITLVITILLISCKSDPDRTMADRLIPDQDTPPKKTLTNFHDRTLANLKAPDGYQIRKTQNGSYGRYLQSLPLKPQGSKIKYFDGQEKSYFKDYVAVIDLPIGNKNLHQCADAVMRLRADYLWKSQQYDKIHFNFTNGMRVDYTKWMLGQRIKVDGNNTSWYQAKEAANTQKDYWEYLEQIWMYAGTLSLSKELSPRKLSDVSIGDVFIQGGSPGHAITVVNIAEHETSGETLILLAQSYMPAQETHILSNPNEIELSPWYSTKDLVQLITPEWTFSAKDLMYFKN